MREIKGNRKGSHRRKLMHDNARLARRLYPNGADPVNREFLETLSLQGFSMRYGDLQMLDGKWYVTHAGLLRLAHRRHCHAINVEPVNALCNRLRQRFVFRAAVYPSKGSGGFVGYGDADPGNVSTFVHGAEMRVAETRAVNRALRKAYAIGTCSIEEVGCVAIKNGFAAAPRMAPQGTKSNATAYRVRDRLCQIIRQHKLDPELVKAYALDFCDVQTLRGATRERLEEFVAQLAASAEQDRTALLCRLNSYARQGSEGVA